MKCIDNICFDLFFCDFAIRENFFFALFVSLFILHHISFLVFVCNRLLQPKQNKKKWNKEYLVCFRRIPMLIIRQFYACNIIVIDFFYEIGVVGFLLGFFFSSWRQSRRRLSIALYILHFCFDYYTVGSK